MSNIINIATKAAYNAANIIQQASRNRSKIKIEKKSGINNYVTEIDKHSELVIIDTIKKSFPHHNILAEEIGYDNQQSECTWIIDPIDGTTNFIHGHPQYSISIGFMEGNKITHGIILDPNRNDLYKAESGKGAYLNDTRIRVSNTSTLENALLATGFPTYDMSILDTYLAIFKEMLQKTSGQRRSGSAALDLAYVAAGYVDGFWEFNLKQWDIAAGYILVKEAGGMITNFENNDNLFKNINTSVIAGNPKIITEIIKIVNCYLKK